MKIDFSDTLEERGINERCHDSLHKSSSGNVCC